MILNSIKKFGDSLQIFSENNTDFKSKAIRKFEFNYTNYNFK